MKTDRKKQYSQRVRLSESHLLEEAKVDADAGVIRRVKVLGRESKNGRTYSDDAMQQAAKLYEGIVVNVDHPDRTNPRAERRLADRIGCLENCTVEAEGVFADFRYLKSNALAGQVVEQAERMPHTLGLSHNADGRMSKRNGKTVVESVDCVRSVDLVCNPATNAGLFESETPAVSKTIKSILESAPGYAPVFATLLEMDPAMGDMPVDVPAEASADDEIKAAFRSMVIAAFDDDALDSKATLAKIKEILKAQEKLSGKADKPAEEPAEEPEDEAVAESVDTLKAELAALKADKEIRALVESCGVIATDVQIEAAVSLAADKRKAFVESLPKREAKATKPAASRPLFESYTPAAETKMPAPKDFAQAIR